MTLTPAQRTLLEEFLFEKFQDPGSVFPRASLIDFFVSTRAEQIVEIRQWALDKRSQVDLDLAGTQMNLAVQKARFTRRGLELDSMQTAVIDKP